jgi:hypothetical protein
VSTDEDAAGSLWVDYADVCWLMPSSFRDPVDHRTLRRRQNGLLVHAGALRRHATSDTQSPETQKKLTALLDFLEDAIGTRRTITSTTRPAEGPHDDHPAAPVPAKRKRRRKRR